MYIAKNTNAGQSPLNEQDEGFATVNVSQAGTACVYGPMHSRHCGGMHYLAGTVPSCVRSPEAVVQQEC